MGALPIIAEPTGRELPDYMPARMVNEFVYCPRLYFYMWVEGLFRESADTVEGSAWKRPEKSNLAAKSPAAAPPSRAVPASTA